MARPVGLAAKKKDNSKKKYREREEWQKAKKLGRPKQVWVAPQTFATNPQGEVAGRWEKVTA